MSTVTFRTTSWQDCGDWFAPSLVDLKEALWPIAICRSISVKRDDALDLGSEGLFQKLRCYLMNWVPSFFSPPKQPV
ncbi:hypothetical protein ACFX13_040752 [Malus domestica]